MLLLVAGHEFETSASLANDFGNLGVETAPGQQSAEPLRAITCRSVGRSIEI